MSSLLLSYTESMKILLTDFNAPNFVDDLKYPIIIEGEKFTNMSEAWSFLRFLLGMRGMIINPKEPYSVRLEDNTVRHGNYSVEFKKCHLFPNSKLKADLSVKKVVNPDLHRVMDYMRLTHCNCEKMTTMKVPGSHIDEVRFFGKKDIVAISYLNSEQLTNFDFSDTISKIYVEKALLNEQGLIRPLISPTRGPRKPKPIVMERSVTLCEEKIYKSSKKVKYYGPKIRNNILKTHSRHSTSCRS